LENVVVNDIRGMTAYWPAGSWAVRMAIGWNRDVSLGCDVLCFAEQREEHEQCKHCRLNEDRRNQGATADTTFTVALLRIAFDETRS